MKDLKCSLRQCRYNQQFNCHAECITVDNEADCQSYSKDPSRKTDMLFEIGVIDAPASLVDTEIKCTAADCAFNRNQLCVANGITVLSSKSKDKAECATFLKK